MARTRLVPRQPNNQNRNQVNQNRILNFGRAAGTGVKQIQANKHDKKWKIKHFTGNAQHIDVRHRGSTIRRMIVRRRAVYPKITEGTY